MGDKAAPSVVPASYWRAIKGSRQYIDAAQKRIDLVARLDDLENPRRGWDHGRCLGQITFDHIDPTTGNVYASCKANCYCQGEDVVLTPEDLFDPAFEAGLRKAIAEAEAVVAAEKAAEEARRAEREAREQATREREEQAQAARLRAKMGGIDLSDRPKTE